MRSGNSTSFKEMGSSPLPFLGTRWVANKLMGKKNTNAPQSIEEAKARMEEAKGKIAEKNEMLEGVDQSDPQAMAAAIKAHAQKKKAERETGGGMGQGEGVALGGGAEGTALGSLAAGGDNNVIERLKALLGGQTSSPLSKVTYAQAKAKDPNLDKYIAKRKKYNPGSDLYEALQRKINAAYGTKRSEKLKAAQIAKVNKKETPKKEKTTRKEYVPQTVSPRKEYDPASRNKRKEYIPQSQR